MTAGLPQESAAAAFGIDPDRKIDHKTEPDREVEFDIDVARADVAGDVNPKKGTRSRGKTAK